MTWLNQAFNLLTGYNDVPESIDWEEYRPSGMSDDEWRDSIRKQENQLKADIRASTKTETLDITVRLGAPCNSARRNKLIFSMSRSLKKLPSQADMNAALEKIDIAPGQTIVDLKAYLPKVALSYDDKLEPRIPLDALKSVQRLEWIGHRDHLCKSCIPISPLSFPSLERLDLCCLISSQDCAHILFHFKGLQILSVKFISKQLAGEPRLLYNPGGIQVERRNLTSLRLVSDDDIGPLFQQFAFPSLSSLRLYLEYSTIGTFASIDTDIWNPRNGFLVFFRTEWNADSLRNLLPPLSSFAISTRRGYYRYYRGFDDDPGESGRFAL
ncbi:hypothetical protein H0H92_013886 [Tricholoma furcatifolium]|nr:hypothetical protein H0H92_013886 [Tricholoma furcatifolium]